MPVGIASTAAGTKRGELDETWSLF
jgi:hypothetical protein